MSLELLKQTLKESPIVKKGDYSYVIHPITDGIPTINPELLKEVVDEMQKRIEKCGPIDKIVTMEAMGIPLASALSLNMNIPFIIIRKRKYGLTGEVEVEQVTGYSKSKLYINDINKNDNTVIVDDVLSTGGTLKGVLSAFNQMNVNVKGVFIAVYKGKCKDQLEDEFNVNINVLAEIEVIDNKIIIK